MTLRYLAALGFAAVLAAPVWAGDDPHKDMHHGAADPHANMKHGTTDPHAKMKGMHHNMVQADWVEALSLEGDKADKVREIQAEYDEERKQLHAEHMQAMRDLKGEREKKLGDVLSEQELSTLKSMWEAHAMPKGEMSYHPQ